MTLRYDTVTFLSDYGRTDEFVGVVHSVIRSIAPGVTVVDLTHDVTRHDVRAGGLALARSANYLCPGVVVAVVDPGVGTERRPVAIEVGDGASVLVGPDNGVLAPAVALVGGATAAVELANPEYRLPAPGVTFDGRDVFAPAAAHLCRGVPLDELGPAISPESLLPATVPVARWEDDVLTADVLWIDGFGNVQLNLDPDDLSVWDDPVRLAVGERTWIVRRCGSYADVPPGGVGLITDSYGLVSVAVDRGSAATELGVHEGAEVVLSAVGDDHPAADSSGVTTPVDLRSRGDHR